MRIPQAVSQNVGKFHQSGADANKAYQDLIIRITERPFFIDSTKLRALRIQ